MNSWLFDSFPSLLWVGLSCVIFYLLMIVATRIVGLRSFTTFSSFDFLVTLAMGALLASTIVSREIALIEGITALVSLFALQIGVANLRTRWSWIRKWVDNEPTMLMEDGEILYDNLRAVRITEGELMAKLRVNNVYNYDQVKAVVLESSGDVSVIQRTPNADVRFNPALLEGVVRKV